jgi:hypothetical protein
LPPSPEPIATITAARRRRDKRIVVLIFAIITHIVHDHDVVLFTIPMSGAAVCWICLEGGVDDTGKPIVRDCACRGDDAGFAHMSCIIKYAKKRSERASIDTYEFLAPWETCPTCLQSYQNDLAVHIADAFVSFAEKSYGYPGNHLFEKVKVMEALRLQIGSNLSAASGREMMDAKDKIENLIHKLLAMVDQAKEEHGMGAWGLVAPTTYDFKRYELMSLLFEAFATTI